MIRHDIVRPNKRPHIPGARHLDLRKILNGRNQGHATRQVDCCDPSYIHGIASLGVFQKLVRNVLSIRRNRRDFRRGFVKKRESPANSGRASIHRRYPEADGVTATVGATATGSTTATGRQRCCHEPEGAHALAGLDVLAVPGADQLFERFIFPSRIGEVCYHS